MKIVQQGKAARIAAYTYAVVYGNFSKVKEIDMTAAEEVLGYEPYFKYDPKFFEYIIKAGYIDKMKEEVRQEWVSVLADKDAKIADKDAEIEKLRAQLDAARST